ncbi:MAG: MFS transporter [Candidatus Puniceispirillales bacterium]
MRAALLSSWSLFFGIFLFMAGNGLQGVLLGTRAEQLAFGDVMTGVVMGGYFFGFFLGSLLVPKLVSQVGHVRVFGALSGLASTSILIHALNDYAFLWLGMRIVTGFAYSGMYIVAESWINDKSSNETRGSMLSIYMIVNMMGLILGQLLISTSDPGSTGPFIIVSVLVSLAVVPILMTAAKVPEFNEPERVSLFRVYNVSPLAVIGMGMNGMASAVVFSMGAVYATKLGLTIDKVGLLMAMIMAGALILQYPIGRLSDYFDRRTVILIIQILATLAAVAGYFSESMHFYALLAASFIFGGLHTPLYSLFIAHANDFLTPRQIVGTASMLIMINGIGAIFGAPLVGYFMTIYGPAAFFPTIAVMHLIMTVIVILRMLARQAMPVEAQAPFTAMPSRATPIATTLLPEAEWTETDSTDQHQTT